MYSVTCLKKLFKPWHRYKCIVWLRKPIWENCAMGRSACLCMRHLSVFLLTRPTTTPSLCPHLRLYGKKKTWLNPVSAQHSQKLLLSEKYRSTRNSRQSEQNKRWQLFSDMEQFVSGDGDETGCGISSVASGQVCKHDLSERQLHITNKVNILLSLRESGIKALDEPLSQKSM